MRHREVIGYIARRLPHQTQRDVAEVIDVLIELWQDELARGEAVSLPNIGTLSIEVQAMRVSGVVRQHARQRSGPDVKTLTRVYGRFRPAGSLKDRLRKETST